MFYAAVCEDEETILNYIEKTLSYEFQKNGLEISFEIFPSGNSFLKSFYENHHYDIIFMDIEMPGTDGISVCREIRKTDQDALVIFISNKEKLVFSSFEVKPFRFIRKTHYDEHLSTLVLEICEELQKRNPQRIQIIEPGTKDLFSFDINQILFIEALGKNCCIHLATKAVTIKTKLMDIEEQLAAFHFIKPHRSYLVNAQAISSIHKSEIELSDSSIIPISRGKLDLVKKEFIQYTTRSM